MPFELKKEVLDLGEGVVMTLSQADFPITTNLSEIEERIRLKYEKVEENEKVSSQFIFDVFFYPKLVAAIVEGYVPTEDEMVHWPMVIIDQVYDAAERMNPVWFEGLSKLALHAFEEPDVKKENE